MLERPTEIKEAYRDAIVAREYIDTRFVEPLGALLHDRQVAVVRRTMSAERPKLTLELAPGPARLTAAVTSGTAGRLIALDASAEMLAEARRRLARVATVSLVHGDAFQLPFARQFDLAYSFRLIRHFERAERARLYAELHRVIKPGGLLIFDAVNEVVSAPLRRARPSEYRHFDALLSEPRLREEMTQAGFAVVSMVGVQHRFKIMSRLQVLIAPRSRRLARLAMEALDRSGGEPLEWILTCQRE